MMKRYSKLSLMAGSLILLGGLTACQTYGNDKDTQAETPAVTAPAPGQQMQKPHGPGRRGGQCQQGQQGQMQERMHQKMQQMAEQQKKMFGIMDENGDGKVSKEEFDQAHANRFVAMDSNDDGFVSFEEFSALRMGPGPKSDKPSTGKMQNKMASNKQVKFEKMDADHDGMLTRQEFSTFADAMFAKMDKNTDGYVEWDEFQAQHMAMHGKGGQMGGKHAGMKAGMKGRKGGKGGGQGSRSCAASAEQTQMRTEWKAAKTLFAKLDTNKDNMVTSAEHDALHEKMIALKTPDLVGSEKAKKAIEAGREEFIEVDTNHDGHWTWAEFWTHYQEKHGGN